jgi:hypothetical protein
MSTQLQDPVPSALDGEPSVVGVTATALGATAQALRDAISELRQLASDDVTISDAVDEVRTKANEARNAISKVEVRYQGAADAMHSYRSGLSSAHSRADAARQRIIDNNSDARYWRLRVHSLTEQAQAGESSQELLDDLLEAQSRVQSYAAEFSSAMSEYHGAEGDKSAAVDAAIAALHSAAETADIDDGFWDRVANVLENAYEWAQENLTPLLETLRTIAELVKSIVDILALIVTILSVFLPFLAPLAAALTLASIALSALILLSSLLLFALGKESLGRVLGDAIGLATSVITSKMGGMNVLKPGAKLAGLGGAFSRTAWAEGVAGVRVGFALNSAIVGKSETVAGMGLDVAGKLWGDSAEGVAKTGVKFAGGWASEFMKSSGGDISMDFFPEGSNGGNFGPFSGGFDINLDTAGGSMVKPFGQLVSGGASNPIISLVKSTNSLTTMVNAS